MNVSLIQSGFAGWSGWSGWSRLRGWKRKLGWRRLQPPRALVIPRAREGRGVNHPRHALLTPALHQHRHAQHSRTLARFAATITVDATFKVVARKVKARVVGAPTHPREGGCLRGYQVTLYISLSAVHRAGEGRGRGRGSRGWDPLYLCFAFGKLPHYGSIDELSTNKLLLKSVDLLTFPYSIINKKDIKKKNEHQVNLHAITHMRKFFYAFKQL